MEDREKATWEPAEEHNMRAYKGVGNKLAFDQQALGWWLQWLSRW